MRLRNRHLACLLLLLSSLSAADARSLCSGDLTLGGRYISNLLIQSAAASAIADPLAQIAQSATAQRTESFFLSPASRAAHFATWTMRPPAAQTARLHAITSQLS